MSVSILLQSPDVSVLLGFQITIIYATVASVHRGLTCIDFAFDGLDPVSKSQALDLVFYADDFIGQIGRIYQIGRIGRKSYGRRREQDEA